MRLRDDVDDARNLAKRPFDFRMAEMADEDDVVALLGVAAAFLVNLGDERAGRVDGEQIALMRALWAEPVITFNGNPDPNVFGVCRSTGKRSALPVSAPPRSRTSRGRRVRTPRA